MNTGLLRRVSFALVTVALGALLTLFTSSAKPAMAAPDDTEWCRGIATAFGDMAHCKPFSTVQQAVNAAEADGHYGTVYMRGTKTYTENVVVKSLTGVDIVGNADFTGDATIDGDFTIDNSAGIYISFLSVTGVTTVTNGKGSFFVGLTSAPKVVVNGGHFTTPTYTDSTGSRTSDRGLDVFANTIVVKNVTATQGLTEGAELVADTGGVLIQNSHFDGTQGLGLHVVSNGSVRLFHVTANKNGQVGAYLDVEGGSLLIARNSQGSNAFNDNQSDGLDVLANNSPITLSHLSALRNGGKTTPGSGIWLAAKVGSSPVNATVTCATVKKNSHYGIAVNQLLGGVLTLNGVTMAGNVPANVSFAGPVVIQSLNCLN